MQRNTIVVLCLLALGVFLGIWLGDLARPENRQIKGTLTFDTSQVPSSDHNVGNFKIRWSVDNGGQLIVESKSRSGFSVWETIPGEAFVSAAKGRAEITESRGMFTIADTLHIMCTSQTVESILEEKPDTVTVNGTLFCNDQKSVPYQIFFQEREPHVLDAPVQLDNTKNENPSPDFNRLYLTYASNDEEHFFGFGEQFSHFDMKGLRVPIWVSEQGVGRGDQPITLGANITNDGAGGDEFTTYAPAAFYMTNKMRAFYLSNTTYSIFDLRKPDRVQVEIFWTPTGYPPTIWANIIDAGSPAEILQTYPKWYRMWLFGPYEWAHSGAIIGMQGGTDKVRRVLSELRKRNTPIAAFWLQDWVGQRTTSFGKQLWWNWELDRDHYPGWESLISDLSSEDIRVLLYINPNLVDVSEKPNARRNLFKEALEKGYLVKTENGDPYLLTNTSFQYGIVDLSNYEARDWLESVIRENMLAIGASGWMADFGESMPYDAVTRLGGSGELQHQSYPWDWANLNSRIAYYPNKDATTNYPPPLFFMRSGFNSSQSSTPLFWEGDQLVSWGVNDGIKSAVTGLNTSGLSGMAFNHSDIGGYTTITSPIRNYHRSRELLYRWMEMNAFTLIFRTHEGNQPDNNVQFYTDTETLDTFAYWARVYAELFDYRKELLREAAETGLPVVRHPFIHYPDDPETWKITYQEFMLGPDFLIAPVTDEGAITVTAYLPEGEWVHLWSGEVFQGRQYVTVSSPMGQPGVFYMQDSAWGTEFSNRLAEKGLAT